MSSIFIKYTLIGIVVFDYIPFPSQETSSKVVKVKVMQSRYRPGVTQRVPGS